MCSTISLFSLENFKLVGSGGRSRLRRPAPLLLLHNPSSFSNFQDEFFANLLWVDGIDGYFVRIHRSRPSHPSRCHASRSDFPYSPLLSNSLPPPEYGLPKTENTSTSLESISNTRAERQAEWLSPVLRPLQSKENASTWPPSDGHSHKIAFDTHFLT